MNRINEGNAVIYTAGNVFYNPKMQTLRDISVAFIKATANKKVKVLDSTAATGVRAIRYALEAGTKDVTLLDINKTAARMARKNVKLNRLKLEVFNESIQEFANSHKGSFGVIDHDPFGSPAPNLFDIMKLSWDGTILMITATDTAVLCGAHGGACIKIYGSRPLHNEMCKEAGLRILLSYTARTAAQFNFGIEPLLSISDMHYMRIFIRLKFGAAQAIESVKESGLGAFCSKCYRFTFKKGVAPPISGKCEKCGSQLETFGPLWLGNIYDKKVVKKTLAGTKSKDARKLLEIIGAELDTPLFYNVPSLTKHLGMTSVSNYKVMERLRKSGAKVTKTQFDIVGFKTDADSSKVLRVIKAAK